MKLVELGARSMDFVDLEFSELGCLAGKKWSGAIFVNLELRVALPNTPLLSFFFCGYAILTFVGNRYIYTHTNVAISIINLLVRSGNQPRNYVILVKKSCLLARRLYTIAPSRGGHGHTIEVPRHAEPISCVVETSRTVVCRYIYTHGTVLHTTMFSLSCLGLMRQLTVVTCNCISSYVIHLARAYYILLLVAQDITQS
jgi:hypothetical protein